MDFMDCMDCMDLKFYQKVQDAAGYSLDSISNFIGLLHLFLIVIKRARRI